MTKKYLIDSMPVETRIGALSSRAVSLLIFVTLGAVVKITYSVLEKLLDDKT